MAKRISLSDQVRMDNQGRVTLTDEDLDALISSSDFDTAGGDGSVNNNCNNSGNCNGTINTGNCINSTTCEGSLNPPNRCTMPKEVPGG